MTAEEEETPTSSPSLSQDTISRTGNTTTNCDDDYDVEVVDIDGNENKIKNDNNVEATRCLYCSCHKPMTCTKCGTPLVDREQTRRQVKALQQNPRHPEYSVFGNGPLLVSEIPDSCKDGSPVSLGIDEAGRGSVLGPMTYGLAYWKDSDDDANYSPIKGFNDSKQLSEEKREKSFEQLLDCQDIGFVMRSLLPSEISRGMLRKSPNYNLNQMSHDTAMIMIAKLLQAKVNIKKCFIDTVGNPMLYKRRLEQQFPGIDFTVESKADAKYPTCSAASVGTFFETC